MTDQPDQPDPTGAQPAPGPPPSAPPPPPAPPTASLPPSAPASFGGYGLPPAGSEAPPLAPPPKRGPGRLILRIALGIVVAAVVSIAFGAYRSHHATASAPETGACVQARNTHTSSPSVKKVDCSDSNAQYVVLAKVVKGDSNSCTAVAGTEAVYTASDKGGKALYALCLKAK
jgi:hypothetical protein